MLVRAKLVTAFTAGLIVSSSAIADAIVPIVNTLPRCDNCSVGPVNIGFSIDFFGNNYSQLFVNNNGSVSFDYGLYNFTFDSLVFESSYRPQPTPVISPFFSGVDTRYAGSPVTYGNLIYEGHTAFAVNWLDVDYYSPSGGLHTERNSFQLLLVERSDTGAGNFDFIFNYDSIQWDNKNIWDTSFFGYAAGGDFYGYMTESNLLLPLKSSPLPYNSDQLPYNSRNSDVPGRYVFEVRNGVVTNPLPLLTIPEPETWAMLLAGLGVVTGVARRRAKAAG